MDDAQEIPPPDVEALIAPHLEPDEAVESVHAESDSITIFLAIPNEEADRISNEFNLGGAGRSLKFTYKGGEWLYTGWGVWLS